MKATEEQLHPPRNGGVRPPASLPSLGHPSSEAQGAALPVILDQVWPGPVEDGVGRRRRVGLLQAGQAVLPAARGRPEHMLWGIGGCQNPLLVLGWGQVGRWSQQLGRVVGAGRVRVVGGVRGVGSAQGNTAVLLLRELGGCGFGRILGLRRQNKERPLKYQCTRQRSDSGGEEDATELSHSLPSAAKQKLLRFYPNAKAPPELQDDTLGTPATHEATTG